MSAETSPAIPAGVSLSVSFSQIAARAMEMIGSHAVMIARTGAISVPCWKAFSFSRKPIGPTMARA
jgi:hypothetical protein